MGFDTSELDAACMADDFSDTALWVNRPVEAAVLQVILSSTADYDADEGLRIRVGDKITAGTLEVNTIGMQRRKSILEIKGVRYVVVGFEPDRVGWVDILLEVAA